MEEQFQQLEQYLHQNGILSSFKEKKRKILIVEDEIISQTKLALILEDFGKCEWVDNGKEAITLVSMSLHPINHGIDVHAGSNRSK